MCIEGRPCTWWARDEVERLNGFLSTGYASWFIVGKGGAASRDFALLKAFRRDAKDGFFENGEVPVVATEDWAECANGALNFRVDVCTECEESSEVTESPLA